MTLSALIRKRPRGEPATAIPAIPATDPGTVGLSIARIATVAVAAPGAVGAEGPVGSENSNSSSSNSPGTADLPGELVSMIHAAAEWYDCPPDELTLMLEAARHDVLAAWSTFGALAQERAREATEAVWHDQVTCQRCRNLSGRGRCLAAWRGEIDAARGYSPVPDLPRRCEAFESKSADPDHQRQGSGEPWRRFINRGMI